jgi:hypothetical protein
MSTREHLCSSQWRTRQGLVSIGYLDKKLGHAQRPMLCKEKAGNFFIRIFLKLAQKEVPCGGSLKAGMSSVRKLAS